MSSSGSPPSPPTPSSARSKNPGTMLPNQLPSWNQVVRHHAIPAADAYGIAVAADRVRAPQTATGYRLYWMKQGFLASREVPATSDGYAVVGRHSSCDVVIDDERAVSLRHVLVRCSSTDDGAPVLNVLDLRTSDGFELSDGTKQHSIAATGPLVFRVGIHAVVALPSTGALPAELPSPIVDREEERGGRDRAAPNAVQLEGASARPSPPPVSRITLMPASVDFSRRPSTWMGDPPAWTPAPDGQPYEYEVGVEPMDGPRRRALVRLTGADLDHGVLIGRADKCVDAGLRSILCENISRVHVLLVRDRGVCHLYDVASMNGTFDARGQRIRCVTLADEGTTTVTMLRSRGAVLHFRPLRTLQ